MPNECNDVQQSSSERDRKWSPNVPSILQNGLARDSHRTVSWETIEITTERWWLSYRPRSWPNDSELGLNKRIIRSPLPKAPTGMFTKLDVERPDWSPISQLARCWRSMNITTSVSNGSGPSLRVRERVGTEPEPDCQSGSSIIPQCIFGYGSIDISLPHCIGRVFSGLYSGFISTLI
jgi:hypothetical protein